MVEGITHMKDTHTNPFPTPSNTLPTPFQHPSPILTNYGLKTLNTARHPSSRAAVSVTTTKPINTTYPRSTVNGAKPTLNVFHKSHSPVKRTFNQRTAPQYSDLKETVNTSKDQGIFDSRFSRHMTGNKSFLTDYQDNDGGFVAFGGSPKGGKITRKGKIRTGKLDFEDVYFVKELKFNLFSISQMCNKKNSVLFTKTECLVLSFDFKLLDENLVLLKVPRQNNMYIFNLKNVAPLGGLTCLFSKARIDESNLWHRRLGHINFKIINKLVRGNLVRGLPSKIFENDHTCVACHKRKQHKASYHLGKFEGKADEGFLVGYFINSKALGVFNSRTRKVEENLHIKFLVNKSNVTRRGLKWLFDIDSLTNSMNYEPVTTGNQINNDAGIEINVNAGQARQKKASDHEHILLPFMPSNSPLSLSTQSLDDKDVDEVTGKGDEGVSKGREIDDQERTDSSTQDVNNVGPSINIVGSNDPIIPSLEETGIFDDVYDDREVGAEADTNNLELSIIVSHIPITRVHNDHPKEQIIGDLNLATRTRKMINFSKENLKKLVCDEFEQMMHKRFQISSMGELTFFLGLQVKQKDNGIFIRQDKYVADILKKFDFNTVKTTSTPMEPNKALIKDAEAKDVDVHLYRSMIGSLMYLIAFRPDIIFVVCACTRKQTIVANSTTEAEYVAVAS
nr:ribonuclease H-like domain-containing protein [Tanacetum cinerariifolium]